MMLCTGTVAMNGKPHLANIHGLHRSSVWSATFFVGALWGVSCTQPSECLPGSEGCSCSDGVCLEGLVCLSEHCVDPDWTPPEEDAGSEANDVDGDGDGDGADGESGSSDNVAACNALVEELQCGDFDLAGTIDCSLYMDYACDIADYFDCIRDAFMCTDGVPDTSGILDCNALATCE